MNSEIWIIDDMNEDKTREILKKYIEEYLIRVLDFQQENNFAKNINLKLGG